MDQLAVPARQSDRASGRHRQFDVAGQVALDVGPVADLDPGWDVGGGILNGGYLLAVAGDSTGRLVAQSRQLARAPRGCHR
jgi:hypothetical protein